MYEEGRGDGYNIFTALIFIVIGLINYDLIGHRLFIQYSLRILNIFCKW